MNQEINKFIFALKYSLDILISHKLEIKSQIVSLIAQDYLEGQIISFTKKNNIFYANKINDTIYSFFDIYKILKIDSFSVINDSDRKYIFKNELLKSVYDEVNFKIKYFYENINEVEQIIHGCELCMLDKIVGKNIYFGTNTKLLMIGEAPARNGWRITGKAWINEQNKIIPSGKILEKLLENTGISLFDISFVELIKCFPSNRKKLKEYASNCLYIFNKQIELIQPEIVITLGEIPTRALLKDLNFKKLSDVAGKEYKYKNTIIIPIFHPSPISPKCYHDNKPIFDNVISKYIK